MKRGTGAIKDTYDIRDYQFRGKGVSGFDWDEGYDIEKFIGHKLTVKDQGPSGSCGGQAWATYGEVLESLATKTYEPRSARWIYSSTYNPYGGGSAGRDNCSHVIKKGWAKEADATSYENGKPPSEAFMRTRPQLTSEAAQQASIAKALSYLNVTANIDLFAEALVENHGLIIGIEGRDNGTWRSSKPKPPPKGEHDWRHWVYVGKAKKIRGKKYIGILNSWGESVGDDGWQWIGEDYFAAGHVWDGWTLAWDYQPTLREKLIKEILRLAMLLVKQIKQ